MHEPGYELAVFDDGTLVYGPPLRGRRPVIAGPDDLARVRFLAALCVGFRGANEGELCDDAVVLRLTCADGQRTHAGSDRCRKDETRGRQIALRGLQEPELASCGCANERGGARPGARLTPRPRARWRAT